MFPFLVWEEMLEPCYADYPRVGFLRGFVHYVGSCSWSEYGKSVQVMRARGLV